MPANRRFVHRVTIGYALAAGLWIVFSDTLLEMVTGPLTGGLIAMAKGLLFVAVTSVLLYVALRNAPATDTSATEQGGTARTNKVLFILLGVVLSTIAIIVYRVEAQSLRWAQLERLEAVARLKVVGLMTWMDERRANVVQFSGDGHASGLITRWRASGSAEDLQRIVDHVARTRNSYGFARIGLFDTNGKSLLADDENTSTEEDIAPLLANVLNSRIIAFSDLHRHSPTDPIHMGFLAPVTSVGGGEIVALAFFEIRADSFLFPLMRNWPLPSASGETVLVRHEGDDVRVLSPLRGGDADELGRTLSSRQPGLVTAGSVLRRAQLIEGIDFQGRPALAASQPVPGTPWTLIAKVDRAEALKSLDLLAFASGVLIIAALGLAFAFSSYSAQRQRLKSALAAVAQRAQLDAAEARFRATFEQAAVGIALVSPDGRWLHVNQRFCEIVGYTREELLNRAFKEITHPDDKDINAVELRQLLDGEIDSHQIEKRYIRKDGRVVWTHLTSAVQRDAVGKPDYFVSVIEDITARKETEKALRDSEERFNLAMQGTTDGLWDWNVATGEVYQSPRWKSMLGYEDHELINGHDVWNRLLHDEDRERANAYTEGFAAGRDEKFEIEFRMRHKDGHFVNILSRALCVHDAHGKVRRVVGTHVDITDMKATVEALKERIHLQEYIGKIAGNLPGAIFSFQMRTDGSFCVPFASPNIVDVFGLTPAQIRDSTEALGAAIHPDDLPGVGERVRESAATLQPLLLEYRVNHPDKGELWVEARFTPERAEDGTIWWHGFIFDVSGQRRGEEKLRQAATVFSSTHEGVVIADADARIVAVNPAFCDITRYSESDVIGQDMRILESDRHDDAFNRAMWDGVREQGFWQGEVWRRRKGGEVYPEWLTISAVRDQKGAIINYVGAFTDITRIKQSEARLEHLANHDTLTGLANRLMLISRLESAIERAVQNKSLGALLILDLDRFKNVNDSLGHQAGDELLVYVAKRLGEFAGDGILLARMGGDEFVILLEDAEVPGIAADVAESLIECMKNPFTLGGGQEVYVGASIGISLFPDHGVEANQLIQHADAALYEVKDSGRNAYRFYDEPMVAAANARLDLEARLRRAIERTEFVLHYQPIVDLTDGRIRGVEALLRWRDPVAGLVAPAQFIPIAEETGLIVPIGEWVLNTACAQMRIWLNAGVRLDTIAVNLAARQFAQPNLIHRIRAALERAQLPPPMLELEITESALVERGHAVETRLQELKDLGVKMAIDDFGTGYSSLAYLKRFPLNKLKIDRSFVNDLPDDQTAVGISKAIIALARTLGLTVLAEGVETAEQADFLRQQGCDFAQGYMFCRPLPATDLKFLLALAPGEAAEPVRLIAGRRA